ncbi:MAG: hypothetical protein ABS76_08205 [Pelagibacterium sp. SCN 64-44]|nr:MAG: hypothetical protein ABS76_08205 [Pelagibacterium sp. SCN 64-44]
MKTLRCVIPAAGQVALETIDLPDLAAGQVRLRTLYTLISPGTELALFNGTHIGLPNPDNLFAKYPFAAGYAAIGTVEASENDSFAIGDVLYFQGKHQAVQVVDPATQILERVPEGVDLTHAPFARLAQIANTGLAVLDGQTGGTVVVIGLGLVGNLAAQLFQRQGARVHAFDTLAPRCDWARQCGLESASQVTGNLVETVEAVVGGKANTSIEATGIGALANDCLQMVGDRGTVVLLGSPRDKVSIDTYHLIHRPGARLVGAHERMVPLFAKTGLDQRQVSRDMLAALADGSLKAGPLLSKIVAPADLAASYRDLETRKHDVLGVLLDWSRA